MLVVLDDQNVRRHPANPCVRWFLLRAVRVLAGVAVRIAYCNEFRYCNDFTEKADFAEKASKAFVFFILFFAVSALLRPFREIVVPES